MGTQKYNLTIQQRKLLLGLINQMTKLFDEKTELECQMEPWTVDPHYPRPWFPVKNHDQLSGKLAKLDIKIDKVSAKLDKTFAQTMGPDMKTIHQTSLIDKPVVVMSQEQKTDLVTGDNGQNSFAFSTTPKFEVKPPEEQSREGFDLAAEAAKLLGPELTPEGQSVLNRYNSLIKSKA